MKQTITSSYRSPYNEDLHTKATPIQVLNSCDLVNLDNLTLQTYQMSLHYNKTMADRNPEQQNELNYMAWKIEHARRRSQLRTQFNLWRERQHDRMCNHQLYKTESNEQTEELKEKLQQRLEQACSCDSCRTQARRTSIGDTGGQPLKAGVTEDMPNAA